MRKKYTKLCSHSSFLTGGVQRLMITDDHLLVATKMFNGEEYRRFFLKDICQMTVFKTHLGKLRNAITALLLLFFILMSLAFHLAKVVEGVDIAFAVAALLAVVVLATHIVKGPTAKVLITTLNSEDTLVFSLYFHKTVKILKKIRPQIEQAQGGTTREELVDKLDTAHL